MNMLVRRRNLTPCPLIVGFEHGGTTIEESARDCKILTIELPYKPAIPLLDKDTRELKTRTKIDISTPVLTAAFIGRSSIVSTDGWTIKHSKHLHGSYHVY